MADEKKSLSPFDFLNSINDSKQDLMVDDESEKSYNAFMVNRGLSYFPDTIFPANEMNRYASLTKRMQYDFLRLFVRRRKRFSKWFKADNPDDLAIIQERYSCSMDKARTILAVLTPDQLQQVREESLKGGLAKSTGKKRDK